MNINFSHNTNSPYNDNMHVTAAIQKNNISKEIAGCDIIIDHDNPVKCMIDKLHIKQFYKKDIDQIITEKYISYVLKTLTDIHLKKCYIKLTNNIINNKYILSTIRKLNITLKVNDDFFIIDMTSSPTS